MLQNRSLRTLGLAAVLWASVALPASAATIYESLFDNFVTEWTLSTPAPTVVQGVGVATLDVMGGETLGRSGSPIVSIGGNDWANLVFSVDVVGASGSGTSIFIAYFDGGTFLDAESLIEVLGGGTRTLSRTGDTLAALPGSADSFQIILFTLDSTTFDTFQVTGPMVVPEPSLAIPTFFGILAMMHVRGRRRS